jgi:CheY-like chemotaxis protein/anti-sigma regulatory factor (Ser/Thr protein kinase)
MFEVRAEISGLRFTLELSSGLPRYITMDAGKLRQILINLLDNAIKFTKTGGVILRARTQPLADDPARISLQLEVEDSGPGIAPEQQKRIFDPFVQTQPTQNDAKGTGLGLAITKSFIDIQGGTVRVESTPGKGALFCVDLPATLVNEDKVLRAGATRPTVLGLEPGQAACRILVVEDNPENRLLLSSRLLEAGLDVREAENGQDAVVIFEQWQPHFIWMDLRMPVMNGYEATAKIRSLPGGDTVKIVAITASVFKDEHKGILVAGCDEMVRKPYKDQEIFECMARHVGMKYIYEDPAVETVEIPEITLAAEMLADLPPEWIRDLRHAIQMLDREAAFAIIERIEPLAADTSAGLRSLLDNFQMKQIGDLLEQVQSL